MDPTSALTAAEILNSYDEAALTDILRCYGEESLAAASRRTSSAAVRAHRSPRPRELVEVIYQAVPAPARRTGGHQAKRTFQALRIAVNSELDALSDALPPALDALAVDGRIVVMAYQSLEDRIVKRVFAEATASSTSDGSTGRIARTCTAIRVADTRCRTCRRRRGRAEPAQCRGATARPTTRAPEVRGSEEGRLMKAKREAKPPRRRSASRAEDASRKPGVERPTVARAPYPSTRRESLPRRPASHASRDRRRRPPRSPGRSSGRPGRRAPPGQGAGEGAESQGA